MATKRTKATTKKTPAKRKAKAGSVASTES